MQDVFQFLSVFLPDFGLLWILRYSAFSFYLFSSWIVDFYGFQVIFSGYQGYNNGKIGLRYSYFESVCLQTPQRRLFVCRHLKRALFLGSAVAPTGGIHFQNPDFLKSSVPRLRSCLYRGNPFSEFCFGGLGRPVSEPRMIEIRISGISLKVDILLHKLTL